MSAMSAGCGREGIFVGAYETTVSVVMTMVTVMSSMMSLATALATELGTAVQTTRNVVFAVSAFMSFLQHIMIAEFATSRATHFVVLFLRLVVVFVMRCRLFVDEFTTVSLVVFAVMLLMLLVDFVPVMGHYLFS